MPSSKWNTLLSRLTGDYGMMLVLLLLCAYYSFATWGRQQSEGAAAGADLANDIRARFGAPRRVLIVAGSHAKDVAFADTLRDQLAPLGVNVTVVKGGPADALRALQEIAKKGERLDLIARSAATASWQLIETRAEISPSLANVQVVSPSAYNWPTFLLVRNLVNIAQQIAVIAILAVGMTMVIIAGGIDLSVGSLVALSAMVATLLIRDQAGGVDAGPAAMVLCCLGGIAVCALVGGFSGSMVTLYGVPPFIVTLSMMLVARGVCFLLTGGQQVGQVPDDFVWLGRGADLFGIPNQVTLMVLLYVLAHVLMTRTTLGRYLYAVGGNPEAARLSGVPVRRVLLFAYTACGALAGVGGVMQASQLKGGLPTYGDMYELHVIAAVVVGGTSLQGGQGTILGTLIGAFIIAVIHNGLNLTGVGRHAQQIVFGSIILAAVLLDRVKKRGWSLRPIPG